MKKFKLLTALSLGLSIACSLFFAACTNQPSSSSSSEATPHSHDYSKVEEGFTFKFECSCGDILKGYRIQFIYAEDGSEADSNIEVSWIDKKGNEFTAKTDEFGYVETLKLPEDSYTLSVNESTLPTVGKERYRFNVTDYKEQSNGIGFVIPLFIASEPLDSQTLSLQNSTNSIPNKEYDSKVIELNKTYFAAFNSSSTILWYSVQNGTFGKYTVDFSFGTDVEIEFYRYFGSVYYLNPIPDKKVETNGNNKFTYKVVYSDVNQNSLLCLKVKKAPSYPVMTFFSVTITYAPEDVNINTSTAISPTHFETEVCDYTYYVKDSRGNVSELVTSSYKPVSGVPKCSDVDGLVVDLTEEQQSKMTLRSDGYYYTADNSLVYAKIDAPSIFETSTLASALKDSALAGYADFMKYHIFEYNEYECCTRRDDYFGFVQAYALLVNKDGLYPLTEEMKVYLEHMVSSEKHELYEMLCTYSTQSNAWDQGDGTQANPYLLALSETKFGAYRISIPANGKVYVTFSGNAKIVLDYDDTVICSANGEYLAVNGTEIVEFSSKDGSAVNFYLSIDKYDDPSILEIGENEVIARPKEELIYKFTAPAQGTYKITLSTIETVIYLDSNHKEKFDESKTYTLSKGETLELYVSTTLEEEFRFIVNIQNS